MADYQQGSEVSVTPELSTFMETQLAIYLDKIYTVMPPSKLDSADVFNGVGGRAYLYLRLFDRTGNEAYLATALEYLDTSLAHVQSIDGRYVGFLWGRTGVYTLGAVLAYLQGNHGACSERIAQVQAVFDQAPSDSYAPYDDFDSGRAGLLYAASFLAKFFGQDVISRSSVVAVAQAVVRRGQQLSNEPDSYLQWISPNDGGKWLGTSHGSAGVLSQLLDVPELLTEGSPYRKLILGTLDYIVSNQFPSGNFPSEYYDEDDDELVQWDHGAPGVMGALVKASTLGLGVSYLDSASRAADCVWERGLLTKGLELCHGITGNTYMQFFMYTQTGDQKYLYRALAFVEFVSSTPELYDVSLMRQPTPSPYMFYAGSYESAAMLWSDLLANQKNLSAMSMPGYVAQI
jgi:lantibiotic modifying enzyme